MLVLTRKVGEEIVIAGGIRVIVSAVTGTHVKLAFVAPPDVRIDRQEVADRRAGEDTLVDHPRP